MYRSLRYLWLGALLGPLAFSQVTVRAQSGGEALAPTPAPAKERVVTVELEGGKQERCRVLHSWKQANGNRCFQVVSVASGERLTLVQQPTGADGQPGEVLVYSWGKSLVPPKGVPVPPDNQSGLNSSGSAASATRTVSAESPRGSAGASRIPASAASSPSSDNLTQDLEPIGAKGDGEGASSKGGSKGLGAGHGGQGAGAGGHKGLGGGLGTQGAGAGGGKGAGDGTKGCGHGTKGDCADCGRDGRGLFAKGGIPGAQAPVDPNRGGSRGWNGKGGDGDGTKGAGLGGNKGGGLGAGRQAPTLADANQLTSKAQVASASTTATPVNWRESWGVSPSNATASAATPKPAPKPGSATIDQALANMKPVQGNEPVVQPASQVIQTGLTGAKGSSDGTKGMGAGDGTKGSGLGDGTKGAGAGEGTKGAGLGGHKGGGDGTKGAGAGVGHQGAGAGEGTKGAGAGVGRQGAGAGEGTKGAGLGGHKGGGDGTKGAGAGVGHQGAGAGEGTKGAGAGVGRQGAGAGDGTKGAGLGGHKGAGDGTKGAGAGVGHQGAGAGEGTKGAGAGVGRQGAGAGEGTKGVGAGDGTKGAGDGLKSLGSRLRAGNTSSIEDIAKLPRANKDGSDVMGKVADSAQSDPAEVDAKKLARRKDKKTGSLASRLGFGPSNPNANGGEGEESGPRFGRRLGAGPLLAAGIDPNALPENLIGEHPPVPAGTPGSPPVVNLSAPVFNGPAVQPIPQRPWRPDGGVPRGMANAFTNASNTQPVPADFGKNHIGHNAFANPPEGGENMPAPYVMPDSMHPALMEALKKNPHMAQAMATNPDLANMIIAQANSRAGMGNMMMAPGSMPPGMIPPGMMPPGMMPPTMGAPNMAPGMPVMNAPGGMQMAPGAVMGTPITRMPTAAPAQMGPKTEETLGLLRDSLLPSEREAALDTLARNRGNAPQVVGAVVKCLATDPAPAVRAAAARTLGQMGCNTPEAIQTLQACRTDADANVRLEVDNTLLILSSRGK